MRKKIAVFTVLFLINGIFLLNPVRDMAFDLRITRDPFMDLLKLKELKAKENILLTKSKATKDKQIQQRIESVVHSISIKMVVYSKTDKNMNTALLVGPSGEPIVVYKNYKLDDDVYVSKIIDDGVVLSFKTKKGIKNATIRMRKNKK